MSDRNEATARALIRAVAEGKPLPDAASLVEPSDDADDIDLEEKYGWKAGDVRAILPASKPESDRRRSG